MIKFGISKNYVPKWGQVQAIREVYQNFIDYGEFEVYIDEINETCSSVRLINDFKPESWGFLKIGESKKKKGSIGGHGEGLKLAGLIFHRNDKTFKINCCLGQATATFYDDENLGDCYGLVLADITSDKFEVYFECDTKDIEVFKEGYIQDTDIINSSYYGDIVNKPKGNIYVGGLYVCNITDLKYALNFKPEFVKLDRDRSVPSTWDIEYYTNLIINGCEDDITFKSSDIYGREFNNGKIPTKLAKRFKPNIDKNNNLTLSSGKTVVTDPNIVSKLAKNPIVAKRIEKLRYVTRIKKSPTTILKELKSELVLDDKEIIKFDSIIKLSKSWKHV